MQLGGPSLVAALGDWKHRRGTTHALLTDRIRLLAVDGRLPVGTVVPSERELARALGLSRTTVSTAYRTLREQGYLAVRDRARAQVCVPDRPEALPVPVPVAEREPVDFARASSPAPEEHLTRAYREALAELPGHALGHGYALHGGLREVRAAVADRFCQRGLPTTPDQVVITNGAQHALALLARTVLRPRNRVVVEHPTYPHALATFRNASCQMTPVAVTASGWDLAGLREAALGASLAYLIPDHQNPTGQRMPDRDREQLRLGCTVVVDETMVDLALDGAPATPYGAFHPDVVTVGSASKTFWGGLRVGWLRTDDRALIQRLVQTRPGMDLGTPVVEQLATAALVRRIDSFLPDRLHDLRAQRAVLRSLLTEVLPEWTAWPSAGGLSLWVQLPCASSSALAATGPAFGVQLAAGPQFGVGGAFERFVRLPHCLDRFSLERGVRALRDTMAHLMGDGERGAYPKSSVV